MSKEREGDMPARMECLQCTDMLSSYIDRELPASLVGSVDEHLAGCEDCRALLTDFSLLRERAGALSTVAPKRDLWSGIEARLTERVGGQSAPGVLRLESRSKRPWMPSPTARISALAAGLVIATAGITYIATRRLDTGVPGGQRQVATKPGELTAPGASSQASGTSAVVPASKPAVVAVSSGRRESVSTSEYLYDSQITALRRILDQRRSKLDPKTAAVIEKNLALIDHAIAESRAALAKDPANSFVADQLGHDLDTKLELLRTVAMLPSHT